MAPFASRRFGARSEEDGIRRNPYSGTSTSRFDSQDVSESLFEARGAQRVAEEVHARVQGHEEEFQIPEPVECVAAAAFAETHRVD